MLEKFSKAKIPTKYGEFDFTVFKDNDVDQEVLVISLGDIEARHELFTRIHSQCVTSEVFGSLKCDCQQQLESALFEIQKRGQGLLIYLNQEGRGIGLANKIKAYDLQSSGLDTVEANHALGFEDDLRDYSHAVSVLRYFKIDSVSLNTNNPKKIEFLKKAGIEVVSRVPSFVELNPHNMGYIQTKKDKSSHLFH